MPRSLSLRPYSLNLVCDSHFRPLPLFPFNQSQETAFESSIDSSTIAQFQRRAQEPQQCSIQDWLSQPSSITMPAADEGKRKAARETIDILHEISTLLVRDVAEQKVHGVSTLTRPP